MWRGIKETRPMAKPDTSVIGLRLQHFHSLRSAGFTLRRRIHIEFCSDAA